MAQAIGASGQGVYGPAAADVSDPAGSSMAGYLDWLERTAGKRATRDIVDGALERLRRQLERLESPEAALTLISVATALRDCGALVGNGSLVALASGLLDRAERRPTQLAELVRPLIGEVRRTASWLRIWRALNTPARAWTAAAAGDARVALQ